jgi:elongation factor Tu
MVMPGDNLTIDVVLLVQCIKCWFTFAIREGGRTVGAGQVTEIVA